jgi:hypothetical protein
MGPACDDVCLHGTPNSNHTICNCDQICHHGKGCDIECSGNGVCHSNGSGLCYCDPLVGWSGTYCEIPGILINNANSLHNIKFKDMFLCQHFYPLVR